MGENQIPKRLTVKDLISALSKLNPQANLVYSCDEEGNRFEYVYYSPTVGKFHDGEFTAKHEAQTYKSLEGEEVVCIN